MVQQRSMRHQVSYREREVCVLLFFQFNFLDICATNNSQVLKKIFANTESIDLIVKNSVALVVEGMIRTKIFSPILPSSLEPTKQVE